MIPVDPDNLECTPKPFVVRRAWDLVDIEDPNKVYEGFVIEMDVDLRDVLGTGQTDILPAIAPFPFSHKIDGHNRSIVVAPMLDYGTRNDNEARKAKLADNPVINALDNSLKTFVNRHGGPKSLEHQTAIKHYELQWPDGVELDGACLLCNKSEEQQELSFMGHTYSLY